MTETEKKALALVNEACKSDFKDLGLTYRNNILYALLLAIERHEAFRQEVSDAAEHLCRFYGVQIVTDKLERFIIAKPDPLAEALDIVFEPRRGFSKEEAADAVRAALAQRGLEIREIK